MAKSSKNGRCCDRLGPEAQVRQKDGESKIISKNGQLITQLYSDHEWNAWLNVFVRVW